MRIVGFLYRLVDRFSIKRLTFDTAETALRLLCADPGPARAEILHRKTMSQRNKRLTYPRTCQISGPSC